IVTHATLLARGGGLVAGFFPGPDASAQCLDIMEALGSIFFRPTGGCVLLGSGTVKDDLTVARDGCFPGLEFVEGDCPLQMVLPALVRAIVGTDQESAGV